MILPGETEAGSAGTGCGSATWCQAWRDLLFAPHAGLPTRRVYVGNLARVHHMHAGATL